MKLLVLNDVTIDMDRLVGLEKSTGRESINKLLPEAVAVMDGGARIVTGIAYVSMLAIWERMQERKRKTLPALLRPQAEC